MVRHEISLVTRAYADANADKPEKERAALPATIICHYVDPNDRQCKKTEPDALLLQMLPIVPPSQTSPVDEEQVEMTTYLPGEAGPSSLGQRHAFEQPSELPPEGRLDGDVSIHGHFDVDSLMSFADSLQEPQGSVLGGQNSGAEDDKAQP